MGKTLKQSDISVIQGALAETGGRIRPAVALLEQRGTPYAYGSVQRIAKGFRPRALNPQDPLTRSDIIKKLRKGWTTPSALAEHFNCADVAVRECVHHLEAAGYNVLWDGPRVKIAKATPAKPKEIVDGAPIIGGWKAFGIISDTHLCSHYQRLDVLEAAYDHFKAEGVKYVYHAGNIVDGRTHFNQFELYAHGITDQAHYCLDHYPQRSGVTTRFITGSCHEGWWFKREGMDFGRYLMFEARERGRKDLDYLGFEEADVALGNKFGTSVLRIGHPRGGTAYATSYRAQRMVASLQGGEKPAMLVLGHFHKTLYHEERNVHIILAGCAQDQTRFMRGQAMQAVLGWWLIKVKFDNQGAIRRVLPEKTTWYDRKYHVVRAG